MGSEVSGGVGGGGCKDGSEACLLPRVASVPAAQAAPLLGCIGVAAARWAALAFVVCFGLSKPASAQPAPPSEQESPSTLTDSTAALDEAQRFWLALEAGVVAFGFTQSKVPQQFLDPLLRLEFGYWILPRVAIGLEATASVSANENYRLLGAHVIGRASIYEGSVYHLQFGWGAGLGTAPRIGYRDLVVDEEITLWVSAGLVQRWRVVGDFSLGLDITADNASMLTAGAVVQLGF